MFTADLFERMVRTAFVTFCTAFASAFVAPPTSDWSTWKAATIAAALAGANAVGSAILALITKNIGPDKQTASMVPQGSSGLSVTRNVPEGSQGHTGASPTPPPHFPGGV